MTVLKELNWSEIATRLKELRTSNKLTIERTAELIGVSTSFIGLIEKGNSGVSIENLYKLSQIFNVSVDYLITGSTNNHDAHTKFTLLNTAVFDWSESEIAFLADLSRFLRTKITVK